MDTRHLHIHTWYLSICPTAAPLLVSRRSSQVFVTGRLQLASVRRLLQIVSCKMLVQGSMKVKSTGQETVSSSQTSCFFPPFWSKYFSYSVPEFPQSTSVTQLQRPLSRLRQNYFFLRKIHIKFCYNCLIGLEV